MPVNNSSSELLLNHISRSAMRMFMLHKHVFVYVCVAVLVLVVLAKQWFLLHYPPTLVRLPTPVFAPLSYHNTLQLAVIVEVLIAVAATVWFRTAPRRVYSLLIWNSTALFAYRMALVAIGFRV